MSGDAGPWLCTFVQPLGKLGLMTRTLTELPVLVLDCQATGASPKFGHLLEIAWCATTAARGAEVTLGDITSRLVALPDGARLPRQVSKLTGITAGDLDGVASHAEVWRELAAVAAGVSAAPAPAVAHWARFERAFLGDLRERIQIVPTGPVRPPPEAQEYVRLRQATIGHILALESGL